MFKTAVMKGAECGDVETWILQDLGYDVSVMNLVSIADSARLETIGLAGDKSIMVIRMIIPLECEPRV
jgi:hypothetical protein